MQFSPNQTTSMSFRSAICLFRGRGLLDFGSFHTLMNRGTIEIGLSVSKITYTGLPFSFIFRSIVSLLFGLTSVSSPFSSLLSVKLLSCKREIRLFLLVISFDEFSAVGHFSHQRSLRKYWFQVVIVSVVPNLRFLLPPLSEFVSFSDPISTSSLYVLPSYKYYICYSFREIFPYAIWSIYRHI